MGGRKGTAPGAMYDTMTVACRQARSSAAGPNSTWVSLNAEWVSAQRSGGTAHPTAAASAAAAAVPYARPRPASVRVASPSASVPSSRADSAAWATVRAKAATAAARCSDTARSKGNPNKRPSTERRGVGSSAAAQAGASSAPSARAGEAGKDAAAREKNAAAVAA